MIPALLDGELLATASVRLVIVRDPFSGARKILDLPAGLSISEMIEEALEDCPLSRIARFGVAEISGEPIESALWHRIRPKPGAIVTLRALPQGGSFRDILSIFIQIAALAASFIPGVGPFIAIGVSLIGGLLVNALFPVRPPKAPQIEQEERRDLYAFSGVRNDADPFGPIPVVLGRRRIFPRVAARPYTEVLGEDQYLRCFFVWGYGPLDIEDMRIAQTPVGDYDDIEIETAYGYPGDALPTLYPGTVFQEDLSIDIEALEGEWTRRTTEDDIDEISIDLNAPRGIMFIYSYGERIALTLDIQARYRAVGDTEWIDLTGMEWRGKTSNPQRRGKRWTVTRGPAYEVELRMVPNEFTSTPDPEVVQLKQVIWSALRGFRNDPPFSFDKPIAWTAIRIRASDQLNGVLDQLNGICTSRVTAFNGSTWETDTPSQNPADLFRWVLQCSANARAWSDDQIALESLESFWSYCEAGGFEFNDWRADRQSVMDTLADICSAARASPAIIDGKQGVIFDEPDAPIVQHFTPRNSRAFQAQRSYRYWPHAFRVRFENEEQDWNADERIVYDDGYDALSATRFEGLQFPGVTNPEQIWKLGRFHIAQGRLRPERYSIIADFEHLVCTRGDRVRVSYDVPLWGIVSARVKSVESGPPQRIVLDEAITQAAGGAYAVRFRLADGTSLVRSVQTIEGTSSSLSLVGMGDLPEPGDLAMFGEADIETVVLRVFSIEAQDELAARLTFVDDAPEISEADQGAIPAFNSQITIPPDPTAQRPRDLQIREFVFFDADGLPQEAARLDWRVPFFGSIRAFEIQMTEPEAVGSEWRKVASALPPQTFAEIRAIDPGSYRFRVRCLFQDGSASGWLESDLIPLIELETPPPDVQDFKISVLGADATLSWAAVDSIALSHYRLKYSPATSGVTWGAATTLQDNVLGNSLRVPARAGTYLIKAVEIGLLESNNAARIETSIAPLEALNVVETQQENPAFAGVMEAVAYDSALGGIRLTDEAITETGGSGNASTGGFFADGYYYLSEPIDLGAVFTSRVTVEIEAFGVNTDDDFFADADFFDGADFFDLDPSDWTLVVEIALSDDPATGTAEWGEWQEFVASDYTARSYDFRFYLASQRPGVTPVITAISVQIDMPDRVEGGDAIAIPYGGTRISFDPPFIALRGLGIATEDLETGDRAIISNKDETGFDIEFRDSGNNSVARTLDYVAKGYGRRISA